MIKQHRYFPFLMWFFPLFFFAYQFILRLWPGLTMHQVMTQFSIDATHFGLLAAFYYYGYAGMQIPLAILLDRFGARSIVSIFAILCGVATFLFTYTTSFYVGALSRFLIGVGSAVGFLGVSKTVSEWFSQEQYAKMIGFSFTFGLMGAVFGGKPVSVLIEKYNPSSVAIVLAIFSIIIGCTTYLTLRSPQKKSAMASATPFEMQNFKAVIASPFIWCLALSNLLMVGSLEGFADVWGVPYLVMAYGLEKGAAAALISFMFFGMLIGGPLLAFVSKKFGNYKTIAACGFGMAISFMLLLLNPRYDHLLLAALFFLIGIMCCYQVIVFAAGSHLVSSKNLGVTIAFLNCINMLGGSFFHTVIGHMMDIFGSGAIGADGLKIYNLSAYHASLAIVPISACCGAVIVMLLGMHLRARK